MKTDLKQAREQLAYAFFAHDEGKDSVAVDRLIQAVGLLADMLEKTDAESYRANNIASCLANGIQPD